MNYTDYENVVYSGQANNKLKIKFNNVEYSNIDSICESLVVKSRILPDDGKKEFSLNNLVSKEATLILHKDNISDIIEPVEISIGTLVNGNYEYVKIGLFNISDIKQNDKDKIEIKLRDYSAKLDFNYDAREVIELNGGSATLLQIFNDIITKASIQTNISSFNNDDFVVSIYDNTIKAREYIAYIAEQAGAMPIIDSDGKLDFIYLNNLSIKNIPLSVVEKYELKDTYKISKVVYQDAIRIYEIGNDDYNKVYISTSNPYIIDISQISDIYTKVNGFEIRSGKTGKILGNPKINAYDIIQIVDSNNNVILKTLGNNTLTYKKVMVMEFDTNISLDKMKENISTRGDATFRKWVKTELDNEANEIRLQAGQIETINNDISDINGQMTTQNQKISSVEQTINSQQATIEVISTNIDAETGNIKSVQNTIGKFDKDGLTIEKSGSQVKSKIDEGGLEIDDKSSGSDKMEFYSGYVSNEEIAKEQTLENYEGKTVVFTKDIIVKEYIAMPNGRFENVEDNTHGKGIGLFI